MIVLSVSTLLRILVSWQLFKTRWAFYQAIQSWKIFCIAVLFVICWTLYVLSLQHFKYFIGRFFEMDRIQNSSFQVCRFKRSFWSCFVLDCLWIVNWIQDYLDATLDEEDSNCHYFLKSLQCQPCKWEGSDTILIKSRGW